MALRTVGLELARPVAVKNIDFFYSLCTFAFALCSRAAAASAMVPRKG